MVRKDLTKEWTPPIVAEVPDESTVRAYCLRSTSLSAVLAAGSRLSGRALMRRTNEGLDFGGALYVALLHQEGVGAPPAVAR
jgi:hypothetical protein